MTHSEKLSKEFNIAPQSSKNIIQLIDEGNTIPFIARYRKEMTGGCDDQVLREFADRLDYLRKLEDRKEIVSKSITEQGFMTPEIERALSDAKTLTEVEDIYRPYKPKRKTRATEAIRKGLKPLADLILEQRSDTKDIMSIAKDYINDEVKTAQDAIDGAKDIIAEVISDTAELRKIMRDQLWEYGIITTKLDKAAAKKDEKIAEKIKTYEMYDNYQEPVKKIVAHRILAINRAEKEGCLKCVIEIEDYIPHHYVFDKFIKGYPISTDAQRQEFYDGAKKSPWAPTAVLVKEAGEDAYKRLMKPSVENEVRGELFESASEQAIKMFDVNLRPLLLQSPVKNKVVLGLDPGYRTGCKIVVVDGNGNVLDRAIAYFTAPHNKVDESKKIIGDLVKKHKVQIIAIGNGTASKESEIFTADLIKELGIKDLGYIIVNEAGASVYSASKAGAEEFPDFDVAHRSAASIARRLQDPLAELIKIDPKSIGVGQYQHDMPQARLDQVLGGVVEDCVNSVGVDLNTASAALLSFVAGLNTAIAKNIIAHRTKIGAFQTREQLLNVPKLGAKAYEQCAGFLRIVGGADIMDNTGVHPENYGVARKIQPILAKIAHMNMEQLAKEYGVGVPTLEDIIKELQNPGRDIRDDFAQPVLRSDVMDMNDLKEGMELTGTVRNVIDFGAFVDIGVHQDGLVHISQIVDRYIKHPSEVLSVGDVVQVRVLGVDKERKRISLTMKT
ncbi:MAG: RNA-binding transcriptional accessory protein [Firmicutes bacterium]|nr:RNA-binding transcriptional accessory protein [Bacillota bacterium]